MPKRFLVSAVILAINRRLLPLKYRVSCIALLTFSFLFAPIVRSCVLSFSFRAFILPFVHSNSNRRSKTTMTKTFNDRSVVLGRHVPQSFTVAVLRSVISQEVVSTSFFVDIHRPGDRHLTPDALIPSVVPFTSRLCRVFDRSSKFVKRPATRKRLCADDTTKFITDFAKHRVPSCWNFYRGASNRRRKNNEQPSFARVYRERSTSRSQRWQRSSFLWPLHFSRIKVELNKGPATRMMEECAYEKSPSERKRRKDITIVTFFLLES